MGKLMGIRHASLQNDVETKQSLKWFAEGKFEGRKKGSLVQVDIESFQKFLSGQRKKK